MKQKKATEQKIGRNRSSSSEKTGTKKPAQENFNTGSHTPSSLRNVGPGYDDTGMAYEKSREIDGKRQQSQKRRKS